jgi:aspartate carbamoyltransferase catalytic subunit
LDEGIRQADVIYMTRIQQERFINHEEYEAVRGKFKLTPKLLNQCRSDIEEHNVYNIQGKN